MKSVKKLIHPINDKQSHRRNILKMFKNNKQLGKNYITCKKGTYTLNIKRLPINQKNRSQKGTKYDQAIYIFFK